MDMLIVLLLFVALLLHPILVWHGRKQAACWLFVAVFVLLVCRQDKEGYDKMDFFPWNEARIVKKRHRDSTVIDCGWSLDKPKEGGNIFFMDDPVVREYAS